MTRARFMIACTVAGLAVGLLTAPGFAATEPALLQASDLPGSYVPLGAPASSATVNRFLVDPVACTQTFEVDPTGTGSTLVQFNTPTGAVGITESVISYPNAKSAKAALRHRAATARAGTKCGTVATVAPGSTTPISSITYRKVKVPKIAAGSYAVARGAGDPATDAVAVEVLSGSHIILLNTYGNGAGPTEQQLPAIARKAETLLRKGA
jgi:hypothetical protein